jgi:hypothetical protein
MDKLEYIPGDLVMTNGVPLGTAKDVVYRVTSSDPTKNFIRKDGTTLRGIVCLENTEGTKFGDKGFLFGDCGAWVNYIVPIVLTPTILRKNGWFNLDESFRVFILGEIKIATQLGVSSLYFNGTKIFSFEYVHELQHFLFSLGINHEMEV